MGVDSITQRREGSVSSGPKECRVELDDENNQAKDALEATRAGQKVHAHSLGGASYTASKGHHRRQSCVRCCADRINGFIYSIHRLVVSVIEIGGPEAGARRVLRVLTAAERIRTIKFASTAY